MKVDAVPTLTLNPPRASFERESMSMADEGGHSIG